MTLEALPKDCPVPTDALDRVKVTMVHLPEGKSKLFTDDGTNTSPPPDSHQAWTGCTIFQLNGTTRKELAMYTGTHQAFTSAKQEAKSQKLAKAKKFKKEKNGVNERTLGPDERAMFKEAKVKELKSFFDHGVWEFQHKSETDEARTLTSRMIRYDAILARDKPFVKVGQRSSIFLCLFVLVSSLRLPHNPWLPARQSGAL